MNYITEGTFFVFFIGLAIAIGVVYHKLKSKTDQNYDIIITTLHKMATIIDDEIAGLKKEIYKGDAKIYEDMANAVEVLEKSVNSSKKTKKAKK